MAPARPPEIGERVAALHASFNAEKDYQHDRWHKLDNDLMPIINLPTQMARDFGKLDGALHGKIEAAVTKAVTPLIQDIAVLRSDVEKLKTSGNQLTGARMALVWIVQTVISAVAAIVSVLALGRHP